MGSCSNSDTTGVEETKKIIVEEEAEASEEEEEETEDDWGDWRNDEDNEFEELESGFLCLFCDSTFSSCDSLFEHCRLSHCFDFCAIRKQLTLDFYDSFKLINYIRSQVRFS